MAEPGEILIRDIKVVEEINILILELRKALERMSQICDALDSMVVRDETVAIAAKEILGEMHGIRAALNAMTAHFANAIVAMMAIVVKGPDEDVLNILQETTSQLLRILERSGHSIKAVGIDGDVHVVGRDHGN